MLQIVKDEMSDIEPKSLHWKLYSDTACLDMFKEHAKVFQTRAWHDAWLAVHLAERPHTIQIAVATYKDAPVAAFPFFVQELRVGHEARFIGDTVSDYCGPIFISSFGDALTQTKLEEMWIAALSTLENVDLICLTKLPAPLGSIDWKPFKVRTRPEIYQSHITEMSDNWEEVEASYFGKSSRRSMKQKMKKLEAAGPVTIEPVKGEDELKHALEQLCLWKRGQLQDLGKANPFLGDRFKRFLTEFMINDAGETATLFAFKCGDELLAATLIIRDEQKSFLYQTAYTAEGLGKYSPGLLLLRWLLGHAHEEGYRTFDFGFGDEPYKMRYANKHQELWRGTIALTPAGKRAMLPIQLKQSIKDAARSNRFLRPLALAAVNLIRR